MSVARFVCCSPRLLHMDTNFTTQPVAATWGADPEFVDWRGLKSRYSIGRSLAYLLNEQGEIKSKVLRRKGCIKGKRVFVVASVDEYIARQSDEVDPALSANCKEANKASLKARREKAEREKAEREKAKQNGQDGEAK
jgi:hypothetical protein